MAPVEIEAIGAQSIALGVRPGGVLLVHTSFRAARPVEGGPLGLVEGLRRALGARGTLVMPTMTDGETPFDPRTTPTSGMGITAELFWRQDGVVRSTHPGASFAAVGPLAERICAPQPLVPPHGVDSPAGRVRDLDGQVLLLGVTHAESTMLHVAESIVATNAIVHARASWRLSSNSPVDVTSFRDDLSWQVAPRRVETHQSNRAFLVQVARDHDLHRYRACASRGCPRRTCDPISVGS